METSSNTQIAGIKLEKAFTERLQTAEVDEYRRNYLRFRTGKAKGARGEGPSEADPQDDTVCNHSHLIFILHTFQISLRNFQTINIFLFSLKTSAHLSLLSVFHQLSQASYEDEETMEDMFQFEAEEMHLYEEIMGFRVAYRRFVFTCGWNIIKSKKRSTEVWSFHFSFFRYRTGHSRGAKGDVSEISRKLSLAGAHILPVAQLGKLLYRHAHPQLMQLSGKSTFHLHIGAGRLGLGLVVPAIIASEIPFAILQRPSSYWEPLVQSSATGLRLKINGEVCAALF